MDIYIYIYIAVAERMDGITDGFLSGGEPDNMRGTRRVWPASQDRQNSSQALGARLSDPKHIQIAIAGSAKVGSTVDVEFEILGTAWDQMRVCRRTGR